jgi:S-DNA-T family DNA segregation ATPase FtsK/SpoIIIE
MSVQRPDADRQRLLPATVEHSLNDLAIRVCGGALVAFAAVSCLSLLSWQQSAGSGPSARAARNLLGSFGAGLSDMMVNTLGIAVVFALICPMVWGLELLASVRWISRFKPKVLAATAAVLLLAGVASGLPPVPGWPLLGGSGGMLGDLVHNLIVSAAQRAGLEKGSNLALFVAALVGLATLARSLGMSGGVLKLLARNGRKPRAPRPRAQPPVEPVAPAADAASRPEPEGEKMRVRVKARSSGAGSTPAAPSMAGPEAAPAWAGSTDDDTDVPAPAFLRKSLAAAQPSPPAAPSGTHDRPRAEDRDDSAADASARAFAERFAPGIAAGRPKERKRLSTTLASTIARAIPEASFHKPSLNLLRRGTTASAGGHDLEGGAAALVAVLAEFGVRGEIRSAHPGPVVTTYELTPARGTQPSRVIGLADDFARELGVGAVRVMLSQGGTTLAIEVPNPRRETIALRDILESDTYTSHPLTLPLALGRGAAGEPIVLDLARMPHLLIAGASGSGKTVGLDAMLLSMLYRLDPTELKLLLIAPRSLELAHYDRIPHLLAPVIGDVSEAVRALEWAVAEMEERYRRLAQQTTPNIETFNNKVRAARASGVPMTRTVQTGFDGASGSAIYERQQLDDAPMPYIVIVIDELADMMVSAGRRVEGLVQRLSQKARATGIHLVMATARPTADVVTGPIRSALPVRICYRLASRTESRTLLGETGAEQLLGLGDMLLSSGAGAGRHLRVHGANVGADEVQRVAEALRAQGEPEYAALLVATDAPSGPAIPANSIGTGESLAQDEIYAAAVAVVAGDRKVSPGHLHRRLGIAEEKAARLIERMEQEGLVGPLNLLGRRSILMRPPTTSARSAA